MTKFIVYSLCGAIVATSWWWAATLSIDPDRFILPGFITFGYVVILGYLASENWED